MKCKFHGRQYPIVGITATKRVQVATADRFVTYINLIGINERPVMVLNSRFHRPCRRSAIENGVSVFFIVDVLDF